MMAQSGAWPAAALWHLPKRKFRIISFVMEMGLRQTVNAHADSERAKQEMRGVIILTIGVCNRRQRQLEP
jgi:hypothetical protein